MCKVTTSLPKPTPRKAVATASKRTSKRRVQFGQAQSKVFHQRLSRSEKKAVWYTGSDFKAMNKDVHRTLRKELCYGFDPNDEQRSWRGLEHIREGVPNIKLERRRSFVRGLLYFHKTMGVNDPEELSAIASTQSYSDQVRAQQFADYDAYEASCVYYEPLPLTPTKEDLEDYEVFKDIPRAKCVTPVQTVLVARSG